MRKFSKRVLAATLSTAMVFSLAACNKADNSAQQLPVLSHHQHLALRQQREMRRQQQQLLPQMVQLIHITMHLKFSRLTGMFTHIRQTLIQTFSTISQRAYMSSIIMRLWMVTRWFRVQQQQSL